MAEEVAEILGRNSLFVTKPTLTPTSWEHPPAAAARNVGTVKTALISTVLIVCVVNITFKCLSTECDTNKE